ncbi:MAG: hypothetical protein OHK0015_47870 [Chloroflexi bacterium OHK40]
MVVVVVVVAVVVVVVVVMAVVMGRVLLAHGCLLEHHTVSVLQEGWTHLIITAPSYRRGSRSGQRRASRAHDNTALPLLDRGMATDGSCRPRRVRGQRYRTTTPAPEVVERRVVSVAPVGCRHVDEGM